MMIVMVTITIIFSLNIKYWCRYVIDVVRMIVPFAFLMHVPSAFGACDEAFIAVHGFLHEGSAGGKSSASSRPLSDIPFLWP